MKTRIGRILGWMGLLFLWAPGIAPAGENPDLNRIVEANRLYQEKQYAQAVKIYENLVTEGFHNGHLYYNLGNAYVRQGELGPAILNYVRAKRLLPRDEDVDANLRYAIQKTVDRLEPPSPGLLHTFLFWMDDLTLREHLNLLVTVNVLFWGSMIGGLMNRAEFWKIAQKGFLVLLILAVFSTGVQLFQKSREKTGVILKEQVEVKSAAGRDHVTLFKLHEGALVSIQEKRQGWVRIQIPGDKQGWVPAPIVGT